MVIGESGPKLEKKLILTISAKIIMLEYNLNKYSIVERLFIFVVQFLQPRRVFYFRSWIEFTKSSKRFEVWGERRAKLDSWCAKLDKINI